MSSDVKGGVHGAQRPLSRLSGKLQCPTGTKACNGKSSVPITNTSGKIWHQVKFWTVMGPKSLHQLYLYQYFQMILGCLLDFLAIIPTEYRLLSDSLIQLWFPEKYGQKVQNSCRLDIVRVGKDKVVTSYYILLLYYYRTLLLLRWLLLIKMSKQETYWQNSKIPSATMTNCCCKLTSAPSAMQG